jgi:hypothetical protein
VKPHECVDAEHEATQTPPSQAGVAPEHVVPHAPQLVALDSRSVQVPLHSVYPGRHVHVPAAQYWRLVQLVPQVPQEVGESFRSRQSYCSPAHWVRLG